VSLKKLRCEFKKSIASCKPLSSTSQRAFICAMVMSVLQFGQAALLFLSLLPATFSICTKLQLCGLFSAFNFSASGLTLRR
ncbi:hypothetical protein, partial [Tenacibaculum finnmarkense]|uniref:hypothetical protein n=1 Tax=Tenacibaculum finnmarkense TaxID=2781243 RepID=UPI001A7EBB6D